ncbi:MULTISPECIES: pentapeptide repeat-containing protein [unclassified Coleofasciculus]|uniref:pentapeptide repeat-containing protein n=1 Tax=unclassified Coleofasciculus TaxID=2692782 RepID=UPI001881DC38|nr:MULTISPECIES: pentapeptide repeat-containing protein [unclassified Coleofasciculus]MBE9129447.1 pentapeptide repeat-containing protein [Coleofasciculus sp. LEGE 07081]MBE9149653.1 pentapeptide repeat-containing protein [Coleofasciculus sp. LEGE 07092]
MKAKEVLKLYVNGRRNFRGENLAGQWFTGEDLTGADFSDTDIRGANFNRATLREAKFCRAKAGVKGYWIALLVIEAWLISGLSGVFAGFASFFVLAMFRGSSLAQFISGIAVLIAFILLLIFTLKRGLIAVGAIVLVAVAIAVAFRMIFMFMEAFTLAAIAFAIAVILVVAGVGTVVVAITVAVVGAMAVVVARLSAFAVAIAGAFVGSCVATAIVPGFFKVGGIFAGDDAIPLAATFAGALVVMLLAAYLGWRLLINNERYGLIRQFVFRIANVGKTSFYRADLTDADFTGAMINNTNFRKAKLKRTVLP